MNEKLIKEVEDLFEAVPPKTAHLEWEKYRAAPQKKKPYKIMVNFSAEDKPEGISFYVSKNCVSISLEYLITKGDPNVTEN